ncbi:hypothetical protein KKA13_04550, partial [Patescibacteria group bacterium]|nr:hypothetical protein [Patescibacteria group bacterium]
MINNLFSSKIMFEILDFLFAHKNKGYSTAEIVTATERGQANVTRELEKLFQWNFVEKSQCGHQNIYRLNQDSPFAAGLEKMFEAFLKSKQKKYYLVNEEGNPALLTLNFFECAFSSDALQKSGFYPVTHDVLSHYKGNYVWFYFEKSPHEEGVKKGLEMLLNDPSFVDEKAAPKIKEAGERALKIYERLKASFYKVEKEEAIELIDEFQEIITTQIACNAIATFDVKNAYTDYLKNYLLKKIEGKDITHNAAAEILLAPEERTFTQKMNLELIKLALRIKEHGGDYAD